MPAVEMKVSGARRIARGIKLTDIGFSEACIGPATRAVARKAWRRARVTTSFMDQTGELRKSIRVEQNRELNPRTGRFESGWNIAAGNITAFYATFIERGTRHIRARNFLRDAVLAEVPTALRVMAPIIHARYAPFVKAAVTAARGGLS